MITVFVPTPNRSLTGDETQVVLSLKHQHLGYGLADLRIPQGGATLLKSVAPGATKTHDDAAKLKSLAEAAIPAVVFGIIPTDYPDANDITWYPIPAP